MEGATESEKNALKEKEEKKNAPPKINSVGFEDLDGTGATQLDEKGDKLDPEKNKTVFMNLINVDEQAQVTMIKYYKPKKTDTTQTAALRDYYENMTDEDTHEKAIKRYEFFSKKVSPMLALTFVGIYW